MNIRNVPIVAAALLLCLGVSQAPAQVVYNFTKIADNTQFSLSLVGPSLNGSGRVAFLGSPTGTALGIRTGDGTETSVTEFITMATNSTNFSIYNTGSYVGSQLAFTAAIDPQTGLGGFFLSDGFTNQAIIVDPTIKSLTDRRALMNRFGQIAYLGGQNSGDLGVYVAQNGSRKAIYIIPASSTHGPVPELHNVLDPLESMQINSQGDIIFEGDFFNQPDSPAQTISFGGLLLGNLRGNLPALQATDGKLPNGNFQSIEEYEANDRGQIACLLSVSDEAGENYLLAKISGGSSAIVTDTRSGPFTQLLGSTLTGLAINNIGAILFTAQFTNGTGRTETGLFTGSDFANDKVIATDDELFGSKVFDIEFDRVGFNDRGQVAFLARTIDGGTAIVRADPIAGGSDVNWIAPGSGSFDVAANWQPANGDTPRVPTKTTTFSDNAVFSLSSKYTVNVSTNTTQRLEVLAGDVTLADFDYTAAALDTEVPSVFVDGGTLTLTNGILHSSHGRIGFSAASSDVNIDTAHWSSQGRLEVGQGGYGQLSLDFGGLVDCAESRIGNGFAGGQAIVGAGSVWTTGSLAVGYAGRGELHIERGGRVVSDDSVVGFGPGLGNTVVVTGVGNNGVPSEWDVDGTSIGLSVGSGGTGSVEITDGATNNVSGSDIQIGKNSLGTGTFKIASVNSNGIRSSLNAADLIAVGKGTLTVEDGAYAEASGIVLGSQGSGVASVTGVNAATGARSTLKLRGDPLLSSLTIGNSEGGGALEINDGALVQSLSAVIGGDLSVGASKIDILGSNTNPPSTLRMDQNMDIGKVTPSTVSLSNGRLEVGGTLTILANGVVQGNGTLVAGNRVVNGGYISPGFSPGRLVIEGDYVQNPGGRLKMEIGGLEPGVSHDQLVINGNATLDGTLELRFISGFAPKAGDTFSILQIGNSLSNGFAGLEIKNLATDFQFAVNTNGTNISLMAMNDGAFVTPLQGQISSSNVLTVGGISYLPYTFNVTNNCSILGLTGPLTRQGQDLFQKLNEQTDPNCRGSSANVSGILPLGGLAPGSYQFHFMSDGVAVYSVAFNVLASTDEALAVTGTSSGSVNLQVNGLPSLTYTIQASTDLMNWFDIPAHVGTFTGPYSLLDPLSSDPAKFYRVKVE